MIRVLVLIAVAGFFVSLVTLSAALAIGGPQVLAHAGWGWGRHEWVFGHTRFFDDHDHDHGDNGPQTTRDLAWSGGDALDVDVPADVRYAQGPAAKITVTGPQRAVADLEVSGGHIRFAHGFRHHWDDDLTIVVTAPAVTRFGLSGSGALAIAGYKQDRLDLDISGDADVKVAGETGSLRLSVSGSGDADLSALKTRSATVEIDGSGDATLAPTEDARIDISGSGDVTLLTHPPKLESNISGSGSVRQEDPASPAPAPAKNAEKKT